MPKYGIHTSLLEEILEQSDRSQGNHEGRGRRKHHGSVKRSLKNFVCSVLVSDKVICQFAG
jgi:hypothetical protein